MTLQIRLLMVVNTFLYRLTGGKLGSRMAGQTVLLLHTTGRKSGKAYITPLNYYADGKTFVLVASNWGKENNPAWYYNLLHMKEATVQVNSQTFPVKASLANGPDYDRLWKQVTGRNKIYLQYQKQTERKIPIVVLTPFR